MFPKRKRKNDEDRSRARLILLVLALVALSAGGTLFAVQLTQPNSAAPEPAADTALTGNALPCNDMELFVTSVEAGGNWVFDCSVVVRLNETLVIRHDTTLIGGSFFTTMISGRNALDTVIRIEDGATLTLKDLHIIDSSRFGIYLTSGTQLNGTSLTLSGHGSEYDDGAAIWNDGGTVRLSTSIIEDNASHDDAAGILNWTDSTLEVDNTIFRNNSAGVEADGSGAGIRNHGIATVRNATFRDNINVNGSGAAIANLSGILTISDSVFIGNTAGNTGAAIYNAPNATLALNKVKLEDNIAPTSADIYNAGTFTFTRISYDSDYTPACVSSGSVNGDSAMCQ